MGTPDGYSLNIIQLTTVGGGITIIGGQNTIYTAQTSIVLPPGLLKSGYAYVFQLQTFKGNSNVGTARNSQRSHGDMRTRFRASSTWAHEPIVRKTLL